MKKYLFSLFILIGFKSFSQNINERELSTLKFQAPSHKSSCFKATFKSSVNKNMIKQLADEPDAFDGIQLSQIAKYNVRVRWKFKNQNRIYLGAETMSAGYGKNIFYLGIRKHF